MSADPAGSICPPPYSKNARRYSVAPIVFFSFKQWPLVPFVFSSNISNSSILTRHIPYLKRSWITSISSFLESPISLCGRKCILKEDHAQHTTVQLSRLKTWKALKLVNCVFMNRMLLFFRLPVTTTFFKQNFSFSSIVVFICWLSLSSVCLSVFICYQFYDE